MKCYFFFEDDDFAFDELLFDDEAFFDDEELFLEDEDFTELAGGVQVQVGLSVPSLHIHFPLAAQ